MNKKLTAIMAAAVMAAAVLIVPFQRTATAEEKTVKIMAVGDSITDGYGVSGSYRKFLYHELMEQGYHIDMVGAKGGGWNPSYTDEASGLTFEYDDENTGYSGYAIKEYSGRAGILETLQSTGCLAATQPDIVILQIGTNDVIDNHELDSAGDRLEVLIGYILAEIPQSSALFVTTIPDLDPNRSDVYNWFSNYRHSADWQTNYSDEQAEQAVHAAVSGYNQTVLQTVEKMQGTYSNLYSTDVSSVITDVSVQLGDGVHPNNTGYKLMGNYWAGVINNYLSSGNVPTESATSEPTEPATPEPTEPATPEPTEPATPEPTQPATPEQTQPATPEQTEPASFEPTQPATEETSGADNPGQMTGDVNLDGSVTLMDAVLLQKYLIGAAGLSQHAAEMADVSLDGRVDVTDLVLLKQMLK